MFVRGPNGSEIGQFVEKVVFNLHESFPKPKRVIKEPPYSVKEAGYAGFVLTIDICLKNRDEPKKVTFEYDLDLQPFKTQTNEFVITTPISDEFKRKCLKGGCVLLNPGDYKGREPYKNPQMPPAIDPKKIVKRPDEPKATKTFTDLFGAPLKKPDPRAVQNTSPNPTKLQVMAAKASDKTTTLSSSGTKEKVEKSKHKDGRKSSDSRSDPSSEKSKKERTKDRDRSEKKEKSSKRQVSPAPSFPPSNLPRNSTNLNSIPQMKTELGKSKQQPAVSGNDAIFSKKSSKKDKKSDKERERGEKKESRAKESSSSKEKFESVPKAASSAQRDRGPLPTKDEREKSKTKSNTSAEPKHPLEGVVKKHNDKEAVSKSKHKKRDKAKDRDLAKEMKKEKQHKGSPVMPSPIKAKDSAVLKFETATKSHLSDKDSSDSDADSPPSIKQESESSLSDSILQKPPQLVEKAPKKPRERIKATDKDEKSRKRKASKKDDRESFDSIPPPSKQQRKDLSKSPSLQDRPSSSDSHNNNNLDVTNKPPIDYMTELKDLKHKITTLKNNDTLQTVVRMIAQTGNYEITKSSFDFDLVQLDKGTVQRLQEFLTARD